MAEMGKYKQFALEFQMQTLAPVVMSIFFFFSKHPLYL